MSRGAWWKLRCELSVLRDGFQFTPNNHCGLPKPEDHWSCIAHLCAEDMLKYSPRAGADNQSGPKFLCQQEGLLTMVICCKFKKDLFNLWLYTHLFIYLLNVYSCRSGAENPRGQNFDFRSLVTSVICYKFHKKTVCSLNLHNFFHDFIHVFSPWAGADNPMRTKFWCQQNSLVASVLCCKFQTRGP